MTDDGVQTDLPEILLERAGTLLIQKPLGVSTQMRVDEAGVSIIERIRRNGYPDAEVPHRLVGECGVRQHAGRVVDARRRARRPDEPAHEAEQRVRVGHIAANRLHLGASLPQPREVGLAARLHASAAGGQDEVVGAALD